MIYFTFTPLYTNDNELILPQNLLEYFQYESGSHYAKADIADLRVYDKFIPAQIPEQDYNNHVKYLPTGSI